jgi:hypothetical protein
MVRKESLRLLFALATQNDVEMVHLDVKTSFLNGKLNETIYMSLPDGLSIENKENKVKHYFCLNALGISLVWGVCVNACFICII